MTENKKYNNSNSININPDINLSVNNEYKNIINTFDRENVTQNLKNNIDCLKNRSIERKFLTLSRESIENSILNKKKYIDTVHEWLILSQENPMCYSHSKFSFVVKKKIKIR